MEAPGCYFVIFSILVAATILMIAYHTSPAGSIVGRKLSQVPKSFQKSDEVQMERYLRQLHSKGTNFTLDRLELEITAKYWELTSWLKLQGNTNTTQCSVLHAPPPELLDFKRHNFSLWTEPGDRFLAQTVWKFQMLVQRILIHTGHAFPTVPTNSSWQSHQANHSKTIFVGDLARWEAWSFKDAWMDQEPQQVHSCNWGWLGPCYKELDSICPLLTKEPDSWEGNVDMIVTYAHNDQMAGVRVAPPESIPWIKYVMESPYILQVRTNREFQFIDNYFGRWSLVPHRLMKFVYFDPLIRSKPQSIDYSKGKTKLAAIFVSNCQESNDRMGYVHELQKYIPVEVIGKCGNDSCPRNKTAECFKMLERDYFFYLAFENANCQDYVTEKFRVNAISNNVVPIALGAPPAYYPKFAPQNSYLHAEDFKEPAELAKYLKFIASRPDLYNQFFEWKGTGEFFDMEYWFCRLCDMLWYEEPLPRRMQLTKYQWLPNVRIERGGERMCLPKGHWYWTRRQTQRNDSHSD